MADIVTMPKLGFDMAEGVLVRWAKSEGDLVNKGEVLAEIETDKATVEVESTFSGTVRQQLVSEGTVVPVGDPIAVIAAPNEEINLNSLLEGSAVVSEDGAAASGTLESVGEGPEAIVRSEPLTGSETGIPGGVKASPIARRMAEDGGIDLQHVSGSGPGGRIIKKDVEALIASGSERAAQQEAPHRLPSLISQEERQDESVPLTRLRQAVGRRMTESKQTLPHFYITHEYDMKSLMAFRNELLSLLAPDGIKLSVNDFILKAVALSLREFPNLNASLDQGAIRRHARINVGVAVALDSGLLTVVCHDTDLKSLSQISVEVREKANRAREGKVKPDDIEGSTFTVSNLGMFDVEEFIAIINPPEAAILAVGSVRDVPVVEAGEVRAGQRMKATISVDHRISDGAEAARFLQSLAKYLEDPLRLLL